MLEAWRREFRSLDVIDRDELARTHALNQLKDAPA